MSEFTRGMQLTAGLFGVGWGICRLARGLQDVVTTATFTAGTSMIVGSMITDSPAHNRGMGRTLGNLAAITTRALS